VRTAKDARYLSTPAIRASIARTRFNASSGKLPCPWHRSALVICLTSIPCRFSSPVYSDSPLVMGA
jgi:hypothetical protein